jgi:F0F1-type ATP synthase delta subunit
METPKKNPFEKRNVNLTEQARIIREAPDLAEKLKTAAAENETMQNQLKGVLEDEAQNLTQILSRMASRHGATDTNRIKENLAVLANAGEIEQPSGGNYSLPEKPEPAVRGRGKRSWLARSEL